MNYDIGNSASLGYIPAEELSAYGERISDVHVKDRAFGGGSVILGKGSANIPEFFELLTQQQEEFDKAITGQQDARTTLDNIAEFQQELLEEVDRIQ